MNTLLLKICQKIKCCLKNNDHPNHYHETEQGNRHLGVEIIILENKNDELEVEK